MVTMTTTLRETCLPIADAGLAAMAHAVGDPQTIIHNALMTAAAAGWNAHAASVAEPKPPMKVEKPRTIQVACRYLAAGIPFLLRVQGLRGVVGDPNNGRVAYRVQIDNGVNEPEWLDAIVVRLTGTSTALPALSSRTPKTRELLRGAADSLAGNRNALEWIRGLPL